jgi:hypothetical protein
MASLVRMSLWWVSWLERFHGPGDKNKTAHSSQRSASHRIVHYQPAELLKT